MPLTDLERITAFDHRFARAQATGVVEFRWGYATLQADYPLSESHNRIAVTGAVSATEVLAAADDVLGGAGLSHRYVSVDHGFGDALLDELSAAGYEHESIAAMSHRGATVDAPDHEVHSLSLEALRPAITRDWKVSIPDATDEHIRQLADRMSLYERAADVTFLGVFDGDQIASRADLYVDRVDNIAQFENLVTHADFRGRGYAGALLREALRRSTAAGAELCVLTADLNGWPHGWYQRFGYADVGTTDHFFRRG